MSLKPSHQKIIEYLDKYDYVYSQAIAADLEIDRPNCSRYLKELKEQKFLESKKEGRKTYFRLLSNHRIELVDLHTSKKTTPIKLKSAKQPPLSKDSPIAEKEKNDSKKYDDLKNSFDQVYDNYETLVTNYRNVEDKNKELESENHNLSQALNKMELDLVEARSSSQQEGRQTKKEDVFNLIRKRSTVSEKMLNDWCFNQKTRKKKYNKSNENRYQRIVNATLDLLDEHNLLR